LGTIILSTGAALSAAPKAVAKAPAAKTARISPVTLAHDGLVIPGAVGQGSRNLPFGTPRARAIELVASKLGPAIKTGVYPECGDGKPLGYADFRGGIQLSFSNAKFVGWTLDAKGDVRNRMANGVGIGTTVATLQKLVPDVFIDPADASPAAVEAALGGPPDIVYECVGKPGLIQRCIEYCRPRGTIVVLGLCTPPDTFMPFMLVTKEQRIQASAFYEMQDFELAASVMEKDAATPRAMVTDIVGLDAMPAAFDALRHRSHQCKVLVNPFA